MKILIRTECDQIREWQRILSEQIAARFPSVQVAFVPGERTAPLPGSVQMLLELERLVLQRGKASILDISARADFSAIAERDGDIILDCSGAPENGAAQQGARLLRPLYDGAPGAAGLMGALLCGRMPIIEIEDASTGAIVATGTPSAETASGLRDGAEAVLSRVILLLLRAIETPEALSSKSVRRAVSISTGSVLKNALCEARSAAIGSIYRLCFYAPHWRVGWRFVDGPGVLEKRNLDGPRWRVLHCPPTSFAADPFPMTWQGKTAIFFELLDHREGKGKIAAFEVGADGPSGDMAVVIEEKEHLSYPFMIEHDGALWMVPENSLSGVVPIYRCVEFPFRWERYGTLLKNVELADCTIFKHDGRFWMMSAERRGYGGYSDTLAIHYADDLFGPWHEHRLRPVMVDIASARPAGNVVFRDGLLWRPFQDCAKGYGRALGIARIDRLTPDEFVQTVVARIESGPQWPGERLHTLTRSGNLECIDGRSYNPKLGALRAFFKTMSDP